MLLSHNEIVKRWKISNKIKNIRADIYLTSYLKIVSRKKIQKIILSGYFRISGIFLKPSKRLKQGDIVELVKLNLEIGNKEKKENNKIEILFENHNLLIINKPSHLLIHPTASSDNTLIHWIKKQYPYQNIQPCHRLDKETTGVLVCSKNYDTEIKIKKKFSIGKIEKTYLALVTGHMSKNITCMRRLNLQGNRGLVAIKMIEDDVSGMKSVTNFIPIKYNSINNQTLVKCQPKTGRQHQIRAHLALEGFPIVGDKLYEKGEFFFDLFTKNLISVPIQNHALHAYEIKFELNKEIFNFKAPCPFEGFNL